MTFNIEEFKSLGLSEGGSRPSQFKVMITPPFATPNGAKIPFACKAATIPSSIVRPVEIGYFGRKIKLAGDREFDDWTVAIYNDASMPIRSIMEKWSNEINILVSNRMNPSLWPTGYKTIAEVTHFNQQNDVSRKYQFIGIFPIEVSDITVDWEDQNKIEEFRVTFAYDYWVPVNQGISNPDEFSWLASDDGFAVTIQDE